MIVRRPSREDEYLTLPDWRRAFTVRSAQGEGKMERETMREKREKRSRISESE